VRALLIPNEKKDGSGGNPNESAPQGAPQR
jgi:hypothetical protein